MKGASWYGLRACRILAVDLWRTGYRLFDGSGVRNRCRGQSHHTPTPHEAMSFRMLGALLLVTFGLACSSGSKSSAQRDTGAAGAGRTDSGSGSIAPAASNDATRGTLPANHDGRI